MSETLCRRPRCDLTIKFSDCDPFGHLYNVRYLDCMFDGREQHVMDNYPMLREEMMSRKQNWVIAGTDIRYLQSASCGDRLAVESSIFGVSRYGVRLEVTLFEPTSGRLIAILWSDLRYIDVERGAILKHPEQVQAFLEAVAIDVPQANLLQRIRALGQEMLTGSAVYSGTAED